MKVEEIWNFQYDEPILGLKLGDINNDGKIEIVAHTKAGEVLILNLNGKLLYQELISKDSPIWHLEIFDIDQDGKNELILGGMDGYLRTYKVNQTNDMKSDWTHKLGS